MPNVGTNRRSDTSGCAVGRTIRVLLEGESLVVKPDVAAAQLAAEQAQQPGPGATGANGNGGETARRDTAPRHGHTAHWAGDAAACRAAEAAAVLRFRECWTRSGLPATRTVSPRKSSSTCRTSSGPRSEVTLEVQAHIPDGVSPDLVRTITENCQTLRFDPHGFEES